MKLKYLLYTLSIICIMATLNVSCMEEVTKGDDLPAPTGESYVSMGLDMGDISALTRAGNENGTADELKIHSLRVVLYDGTDQQPSTCKVEYVFDLDVKSPTSWSSVNDLQGWLSGEDLEVQTRVTNFQFSIVPKRVAEKAYKMLVLVNGQGVSVTETGKSIYNVTRKGCYLYQLNEAITAEVNPLTGVVKGGTGIFMSNHQGLVNISKTLLSKTANEAKENPIVASVDRLVAKVTIKHSAGFVAPKGINVSSATWGLAITNKKTYWMRGMTDGETKQDGMSNLYAKDPNYDSPSITNMDDHFNKLIFTEGNGSVKFAPSFANNSFGSYEYTLENTTAAVSASDNKQYMPQTTHVVVGYKYTPDNLSQNESYFIFNNKIISVSNMTNYASGVSIPASLKGLDTAISSTNQTQYPLNGSSTQYFETNGIRFCPQGQIYYTFPIRHFNKQEGSLGYYGVVRNNIYEISINSLTTPESESPSLSADITILPWANRTQSSKVGISVFERIWREVKIYHCYHNDGANIYNVWTNGARNYQTILAVEGGSPLTTANYSLQKEFNQSTAITNNFGSLYYTYSVPLKEFVVGAGENVFKLYYTNLYVYTSIQALQDICFIKADGTILRVQGTKSNGTALTSNPEKYDLHFVTPANNPDHGCIFVKNLPEIFNLTIRDANGTEYVISSADRCIQYYNVEKTKGQTRVSYSGYDQNLMTDPVYVRVADSWVTDGSRGVAVVCVPK